MVTILKITEEDYEAALDIAAATLASGGLIIYPTDTVYGIGGDATSQAVVDKIHKIKNIPAQRPMSVMLSGPTMMEDYCETGIWEDVILSRHLPGPYTFVVKLRSPLPVSQTKTLGVRIPDHVFCQKLCEKFGKPIVSTSANTTGAKAPVSFDSIEKEIIDAVDIAVDGGPTKYLGPSLVIDLIERKLIREGGEAISLIEFPQPDGGSLNP